MGLFITLFGKKLAARAKDAVKKVFEEAFAERYKSFGNGRFVRNFFEQTLELQANRIATEKNLSKEILTSITAGDIPVLEKAG